MLIMNYLSQYHPNVYLTLDIQPNTVRCYYCDFTASYKQVKTVAEKLGELRIAGSELKYHYNEKIDKLTFDVTWIITD